MSYLQFEIGAMDRCRVVASLAALPGGEFHVAGGLLEVWTRCWREKVAELDAITIVGLFKLAPTNVAAQPLLDALVSEGFLDALPALRKYRVRGAEKRLGLLKARQKAAAAAQAQKAGKAPEPHQEPARAIPEPVVAQPPPQEPKAERPVDLKDMKHAGDFVKRFVSAFVRPVEDRSEGVKPRQDESQDGKNEGPSDWKSRPSNLPPSPTPRQEAASPQVTASGPGHPGKPVEPAPAPEPKPAGEHQQVIDALCASYQRLRGSKYGFTGRDAKAVEQLRKLGSTAEIVARWEHALNTQGYRGVHAIWELPAKWNAHPMEWVGPPPDDDLDQRVSFEEFLEHEAQAAGAV